MGNFGAWTLLPPVLVILFAVKTKRPIEALILGCVSCYVIIAIFTGQNFISLLFDSFFSVATDYDNVWLLLVCGLFGSLIALMNEAKGTEAIAGFIGRFCSTGKRVLLAAWGMGLVIFIDDYMNIMTISSCLKKLCDKIKIPRAALAYVIDSTGAPTCVLVPFSTWAVFFAASFYEQDAVRNLGYGGAIATYVHAIPYMFYAVIALIVVLLFIISVIPPIGAMKKEYETVVFPDDGDGAENPGVTGNIIDFLVPIGLMITVTVFTDDMLLALIVAILSCALLYLPRRIITPGRMADLWLKGFGDLVPTLAIMLFSFYMKRACADINLPEYVINLCIPYISRASFPAVSFAIVCILSFITGDNWGVPSICVPIIIPLACACNANILLTMATIVSGGVFCSHACFYSDATVLTSTCCEIDNMSHARTQLPYAGISFAASLVCYIIAGFVF